MLVPLLSGALAAGAGAEAPTMHGPLPAELAWAAPLPDDLRVPEAAPPPRWEAIPVSRVLHPVGFHYGSRFQAIMADTMGGPRASGAFGPVVAQADVHWRLLDATGRGLPLDALSPEEWRDTAVAGSLLTGERLLDEALGRAPVLYGVYLVADTVLSPSFDVRRRNRDQVEVTHRSGGPARRAAERADEELGPAPVGRKPPPPALGVGLDWELRDVDAPPDAALIRYTAWMNLTEIGLSSVRLELAPESLAWVLSGREQLRPRLYLIGSARSAEDAPDPARLSGGLMWLLPWRGSWNLRLERIVSLDVIDERWMITLRCENHTGVPAPLAPPLGDRGRGGPVLPWAPERSPGELTRWDP
ncbi:MAG: hypothetical protein Q8P18_27365 [Pseudomonadota bacterium]|nr:hypothetical protein [Pseudomonadota bacterium]